ncbi:MAG: hypothetical protein QW063_01785 [Candidatus Nanoarchaeia archaeon]
MRYKTKYSESEEFTVYRYFHYTPKQLGVRGFLATICAAITVFLLTPLPDEIFIIPVLAKAWQYVLQLELDTAILYAYGTYKGTGILFLLLTLLFGAQYLRDAIIAKTKAIKEMRNKLNGHLKEVHKAVKIHTEKIKTPKVYYKLVARKKTHYPSLRSSI